MKLDELAAQFTAALLANVGPTRASIDQLEMIRLGYEMAEKFLAEAAARKKVVPIK